MVRISLLGTLILLEDESVNVVSNHNDEGDAGGDADNS
jgi:hypothetical protein